jgi:hypothetical protein
MEILMLDIDHIAECIMVDTLGLVVPDVDVSKLPRKFLEIGGSDSSKWATGQLQSKHGRNSLKAKGVKSRKELRIEGSPAGHYQGHNIVSSGDARMLAFAQLRAVKEKFGLAFPLARACEFAAGKGMRVSRIDTPVLLAVPEGLQKSAFINGLALAGIQAGMSIALYSGETVYFDPSSQLAAAKGYDKAAETKKQRRGKLPDSDEVKPLLALADGTIRFEAVYRQKYLDYRFSRLPTPAELHPEELATMLAALLEGYDLRRDIRRALKEDELLGIPRQYRHIVFYWQHGRDVLKLLDGDETAYARARAYLRLHHSINIEGPPPGMVFEERINVGDLLRPENFIPVPPAIRSNSEFFFELPMAREQGDLNWRYWGLLQHQRRCSKRAHARPKAGVRRIA